MVFRKYGLVPSRSQTMVFGNPLVHATMDDLHQLLIPGRGAGNDERKEALTNRGGGGADTGVL